MIRDRAKITVETTVHPTETKKRVERAVRKVFPGAEFEYESDEGERGERVTAEAASVERMSELIDERGINETARDLLEGEIVGDTVVFHLSKQPAYVGRLNFDVGGHELGSFLVRIEAKDPNEFVRRVTEPGE